MFVCFFPPQPGDAQKVHVRSVFFVKYPCMTINDIIQCVLMHILLFNQAHIPVCLDGTIIDSSTILVTMYYCGYVGV